MWRAPADSWCGKRAHGKRPPGQGGPALLNATMTTPYVLGLAGDVVAARAGGHRQPGLAAAETGGGTGVPLHGGAGRLEPGMLVGGVVGDQVQEHPQAPLAGFGHQPVEILQRAERGLDVPVVREWADEYWRTGGSRFPYVAAMAMGV